MACCSYCSRTGVFFSALVIFLVLVGVFFGVYMNKNGSSNKDSPPTVTVQTGAIQGEWLKGAQGDDFKFAAFRGIPYAQPPVGELRFKGPRPPLKWVGVRSATTEGSTCWQEGGTGSEDCLYLNVYTPKLPSKDIKPKLPVYVFIHGGVFIHGNANMSHYGPHFLVQQDIVVVTMNYRLGVLAHLCLDTDDVPGNADLKDQVQVLRWVNENIDNFGGDSSKVTLGGHSSGGVSASWLSILPATKGLIRSAITQSGTALSGWGYTEKNIIFAKKVYELLAGEPSDDLSTIARKVVAARPLDLYNAAEEATSYLQATHGLGTDISYFHTPCIERRGNGTEEKLITKDPESYIIQNETNHIPLMLGETKREWAGFYFTMFDISKNETHLQNAIKDLTTLVPKGIVPGIDTQALLGIRDDIANMNIGQIVTQIRDYYFHNTDGDVSCNDNCKMAKYFDYAYILSDTSYLMRLRSRYSTQPTYGYVFNFKSEYNANTTSFPDYARTAVVHGDDLAYIWKMDEKRYHYNDSSAASTTLKRMVSMVANFIREGNPTPKKSDLITEIWQPVKQYKSQKYLEITENITQINASMEGEDDELWTNIFDTIRVNKNKPPVVTVEQGILQGEWIDTDIPGAAKNRIYASFQGIPYARPPLKELRFKAPRPATRWTGIRTARQPGSECLQQDIMTGNITGSEDCLYLNVYSPQLPKNSSKLLPVYFFIHGGAFVYGSGVRSYYGPEFFVLEDIVVVTINYRLNVFGFLNLDDDNVPGNAGIKDMIAALEWVHRNVAKFGGDPSLITVGGQSAGAAAAHWLTLLPASRNLMKGVVLESGTATHSWAYNEDNYEVAVDLGRRLVGGPTNLKDISQRVMELPAMTLMEASVPMVNQRSTELATQIPYAISPERRNEAVTKERPLITQDSERYVLDPAGNSIPMLMGMNTREYLTAFYSYGFADHPEMVRQRIDGLQNLIQKNIIPYRDTVSFLNLTTDTMPSCSDTVETVRKHFFERNDQDCNLTCTFKKYQDDISFGVDTHRLAELRARAKSSETFVYRFGVRDLYNLSPLLDPDQLNGGAVHADEQGYLWKMPPAILAGQTRQKLEGDGLASTTLRRMTTMFSSFIKTGSPATSKDIFNGTWETTEKRKSKIIFMEIGQELSVKEDLIGGKEMPFWLDLYQIHRGSKSV